MSSPSRTLEKLRDLCLGHEATAASWQALCQVMDTCAPDEREVVLDYVGGHVSRWPEVVREAPTHWRRQRLEGKIHWAWHLVSSYHLVLSSYRQKLQCLKILREQTQLGLQVCVALMRDHPSLILMFAGFDQVTRAHEALGDLATTHVLRADSPEMMPYASLVTEDVMQARHLHESGALAHLNAVWLPSSQGQPSLEMMLRSRDLVGADLRGADLSGLDLSRADLQGADLSGADLSGACLETANLRLVRVSPQTRWPEGFDPAQAGCLMPGASLRGLEATHALDLSSLDLSGADLSGARLLALMARGADLSGVLLEEARLPYACFASACLKDARMSGAELLHTDFSAADLRGADLRGADLQRARMPEADLRGAKLQGADLRGADLTLASLEGASLSEVIRDEHTRLPG